MTLKTASLRRSLLGTLFLAACMDADGSARWGGSMETLPNGTIRTMNPAPAADAPGWTAAPELSLGEAEGSPEETFGSISSFAVDDSGRLLVLDRQSNELRIFGADGSFIRSTGRTGEGPGEYTAANGLARIAGDSLLVVDQQGARYSIVDAGGSFVRSVQRQLPFYGWAFRGGVVNGRVYEMHSVGEGEARRPALLGTSLAASASPLPQDTVLLPQPDVPPVESFSVTSSQGGMYMSVPFTAVPIYHLTSDGHLWHGHGSEFRIFQSTLAGDTIREILLEAVPTAVTAEELSEWENGRGPQEFRRRGGKLDMSRIPAAKPYFDDLYVSPAGELWVSVPAEALQTRFRVFDAEGRFLNQLTLQGMRRDVYAPISVRGDLLYFVGRDELDVQRVYVFRIGRGGAAD